jgi:hypothetical protein
MITESDNTWRNIIATYVPITKKVFYSTTTTITTTTTTTDTTTAATDVLSVLLLVITIYKYKKEGKGMRPITESVFLQDRL